MHKVRNGFGVVLGAALVMLAVITVPPLTATAQDLDEMVPLEGTWAYVALNSEADCGYMSGTSTLEDRAGDPDFQFEFSVYVLDGGERLLFVFDGDDYEFTRTGPGVYSGTMLDPGENRSYESTLIVDDSATMSASAIFRLGEDCVYTYDNSYVLMNESPAELWTETEREFTNYTFPSCLGLMDADEPSGVWIRNDVLVPVVFPEDDVSGVYIGKRYFELADEGAQFQYTTAETIADSTHVYTWLVTPLSTNSSQIDFLYQVDGRADCAVAYTSNLIRVTEDFEAFVD